MVVCAYPSTNVHINNSRRFIELNIELIVGCSKRKDITLQINVIALALILWGVGTQPRAESESNSDMSSIIQSFLESPNMPRPVAPTQTCDRCGRLSSENLNESVISNVNRMFRSRFQGTTIS